MEKSTFYNYFLSILFVSILFFKKRLFLYVSSVREFSHLNKSFFSRNSILKKQYVLSFLLLILFLLNSSAVFSQVGTKFTPRLDDGLGNKYLKVQGDVKLIGNTILTPKGQVLPYNGTANNNDLDAVYVDIDNDNSTVSSSSADLLINNSCKRIVFAGLYWSAMYPNEVADGNTNCFNCGTPPRDDWNQVKFKIGTGAYVDIIANKADPREVIFKGANTNDFNNGVYVCFKDVTSLLQPLANADQTYTVANLRATNGQRRGGAAGGWTLVVIYESPTLPSKFISVFDGAQMTNVDQQDRLLSLDIPISGFQTLPAPFSVKAKIGVAALDGDYDKTGDGLLFINGLVPTTTPNSSFTSISNPLNPATPAPNFFNATITVDNTQVTTRNPTNRNNLGFDIDYLEIPNGGNAVIPNGATSGTYRMFTNTTGGDGYAAFVTTFAVDIIEPNIKLTKKVINTGGTDITNQIVNRGDELRYVIGFQNIGSDKAKNLLIEDYLPNIVFFNYPADLLPLPAGVTVQSYNPAVLDPHDNVIKRKIVFSVDNSLVDLLNDQERFISFKVRVPVECKDFSDACSNEVKNIAYSIYTGDENKGTFGSGSQPPSVGCALGDIATNFIGNIDGCLFDNSYTLCGNNVEISGRNGFQNYRWTGPNGFTATGKTITVTQVGNYIVNADPIAPCLKSLTQTVTVTLYSNTETDALLKYAANLTPDGPISDRGEVVQCAINGKKIPHIFLCGAGDHRDMTISNSSIKSVEWYQLTGAACIATAASNNGTCANEDASCSWNLLQTSPNYSANTAGYFKAKVIYDNDCFNVLFFNVYKNDLNPTATKTNIICTKPGTMTVSGVPASGYEYSFNVTGYTGTKTYTSGPNANVFSTTTPQNYTASIRQIGVANGCVFTVSAQIDLVDFEIDAVPTQPTCTNVNGSISVTATAGATNYVYQLSKIVSGVPTIVQTVGPNSLTNNTFLNQSPGTYSVNVKTDEGCNVTVNNIVINTLIPLTATLVQTKPLTCTDGEITISAAGGTPFPGTPPYYLYSVNGAASVDNPVIPVTLPLPTGGIFNIKVVDQNNCEVTRSITITAIPKPVYNVGKTDIICYGSSTGAINFNVTSNPGGQTLSYSIDGINFQSNPTFSNLPSGTYKPVLKYIFGVGGEECTDAYADVIVAQPASAVTASGGVAELADCDPAGTGFGKLRITNVQGGTPGYQYSFDGGVTWQASNEKYVMSGSYTLVVKDSKDCTFSMTNIILDPKPTPPTLEVEDPVFNCDGTATSTVTVTNSGGANYTYQYLLDGVVNTNVPPNVFLNVPSVPANHTVSVIYNLQSVSTYSNLLNEDFGSGEPTTTSGIASAYCFNDQRVNSPYLCGTRSVEDNQYSVAYDFWRADDPSGNNSGAWYHFKDHTTNGSDPKGRFLLVNIGSAAGNYGVLYSKPIVDVIPGQPVKVDLYLANLIRSSVTAAVPDFIIELVDGSGTVVASQATGLIPNNEIWNLKSLSLIPTGNNTSLTFKIRSGSILYGGNDALIDDIQVYQLPKSCITQKDFPIIIESNKAFSASIINPKNVTCAGINDGEVTIPVENFDIITGYQYSLDGGIFQTSSAYPLVLTGLGAGTHTIIVKSDATGTCSFTLTQVITAPSAIVASSLIVTQPTCTNGATIRASATGGSGAYQYELRTADGLTAIAGYEFSALTDFVNVPTGTYTVVVKDVNGCISPASSIITITAPTAPTASLDSSSDLCYDVVTKATLVVNVTGGTSPFSYSLDGQAGQNSNTFSNVNPGTHNIVVTDSNNCQAPISNIVIAPALIANAIITKTLDCSASPDATIGVTITDGIAPYTYKWKLGAGIYSASVNVAGNTFSYPTDIVGSYTFEITDSIGCITTTTATIDPITNPTATANTTDPSCNNGTNGQIEIIGAGGSGGFTYSFNGNTTFISPAINTGLNAYVGAVNTKNYTYQVKDSKGCLSPIYTATLNNPTPVVASASFVPNTTCSTTTNITLSGAGGSGIYTYNFDGSTTYASAITKTFTNTTSAQTITYSVKDSKGCIDTKTIIIPAYNPPTDITFSTPAAISCNVGFTTTSITLTSVGGVAPFTYTVISGPTLVGTTSTGTFAGLTPGNYTFEVEDANGCTKQTSTTIAPAATIAVAGAKTDVKCFGTTDGTATFTVTGVSSSGNYNYTLTPATVPLSQINKSGNTVTVTGLGSGVYTLVVTDITTGCTSNTASVTVNAPSQIAFTLDATKISCNNKISTISFPTLSGGTPGYTYAYVVGGASAPAVGAYSTGTSVDTTVLTTNIDVYVKDVNGCFVKNNISILSEDLPTIDPLTPPCYTGTAIAVTITGTATGTTTYSKDGTNFQASPNFSLTSGNYTLTIKDGFGCVASIPYVIAPQLSITASPVVDITCTTDTTINLSANGGTGAYTYQVSLNGGAYAASTNPYVTAVAGTYTFRVTDSATPACQAVSTDIIVVTKATVLTLTTTKVDVKCKGDNTGSISITPTSGKAPFTYSTTKVTTPFTNYITNNPSGLVAGDYNIVITDALGCTSAVTTVTIAEPLVALSATAVAPPTTTCTTATTVTVTGHDGTPGYTYSFNGGAFTSTNTYVVNDNGTTDQTVAYRVKDANGCITVSQDIIIKKLNPPTAITFSGLTPITCNITTTNITLTPVGGVAPFSYITVSGTTINVTGATTGIFTGLLPGNYVFQVTDANGCSKQEAIKIAPVAPIVATATKLTDVKCFGDATGSISYNVSGFATTYSYKVNALPAVTGQTATTFTLPNLGQGIYSVVFTDETTLCTATTSITINQPTAALTASETGNVNANCKTPYSVVTITATGGTPNYKYAFVQNGVPVTAGDYVNSNVANLDPTVNTQWDVWVQDANGCTIGAPIDVTIVLDLTPTVTTSVVGQCTASGSTFQIVAVGSGGVAPYVYTINTGLAPSPANTFTVAPGTYTVTVTDANGCTGTSIVTVNEVLTATAVLTKGLDCTATPDASISVTVLGGIGPFSYQVKIGAGAYGALVPFAGNTFTYPAAAADDYQFQITDSNVPVCTKVSNIITVNPIVYPLVTLVAETQTIKCNGDDTGVITVTIDPTQGVGPFEYSINGGTYQASNIFTGLTAGLYNVTVRDSKDCVNTIPAGITISEPTAVTFTKSVTPITCNTLTGVSLGSITISSVSGGTPNYTYHVTGVNGYDVKFINQTGLTAVFDVVDFGLYQIIITDANGCTAFENDILIASPPDDLDITVTAPPADCSALGSAVIAVGGPLSSVTGPGPYHFAVYSPGLTYTGPTALPWYDEDGIGSKKTTIPNLLPGVTYTFIVHDALTGCYYFETSTIAIPTNSTITVDPLTANNITCKGAADGSVTFTMNQIYGVSTPVTYQIYNAQSVTPVGSSVSVTIPAGGSLVVNNFGILPFGNYFVLVTEAAGATHAGCSVTSANFNITESAVALTVSASVIKNENCNKLGIINALAKDGTAPYEYMVTNSATAPLATDPAWGATSTFTLAAGSYYVHAKDAYGCIKPSALVDLVKDPEPAIALSVTDNCVTVEGTFELNVALTTAGIAPYTIVVNGSAAQNVAAFPFVVSGLNSGPQSVTVTDANGCPITETLTINKPLVATPAITKLPTCAINDGIITMSGTGGTGSYTYTISPMPGTAVINNTTGIISGLPAGTYTVTMTDTATPINCTTTAVVTLSLPTQVVFITTTTPALCVGDSNGSITVILDATNNNPNYTYEITAPITRVAQSSNVFTGLLAGTYTVKVNSGRGCSTDDNTVVVDPAIPIVATVDVTTKLTCDSGNNPQQAVVTVTGAGGTGTYEYSFDGINYSNKNTYETYSPETVTGYVRDANGCVDDETITIDALDAPTGMDIAGTPIYCVQQGLGDVTSTVTISNIQNGVGPFTYQNITSGTSNGTGVFAGLSAGEYTFQVTDNNGCTYQEIYKVKDVTPIAIVGAIANTISCNALNGDNANGSATFTVTGFSATGNYNIAVTSLPLGLPYNQVIVNDVITLTDLVAGTYTVTVEDITTGCTIADSVTLTEPVAITFTATPSNVFCTQTVSQITVSAVTGGTGVYTYAAVIENATAPTVFDSNPVISVETNLTDLVWDVYVKDANGCVSEKVTTTVIRDAAPAITVPTGQCFTGTALTTDLSTVTTTYNGVKSYTVNGFPIATSIATFNSAGTYTLGIKDDHGCEAFVDFIIEKQLLATATLTKDLYCAAPIDATIEVEIQDGVAPYSYQMYMGAATVGGLTPVVGNSFTATATVAGTYHFVITDSNGASCAVTTNDVVVTTPITPTFTYSQINVSCTSGTDGSFTVIAADGLVPYKYKITVGTVNTTGDTSGIYTGLAAGVYTVEVTDAKGCVSATQDVTITEPIQLTATATPSINTTCSVETIITVVGHDGTPTGTGTGYYYSFDNGVTYDTSNTFTVNDNGTPTTPGTPQIIWYAVKDANGCTTTPQSIIVNPLDKPTDLTIALTVAPTCPVPTATVTLTATNGVGVLQYETIAPSVAIIGKQALNVFAGLAPGDYTFQVTDANGCTYQELYKVDAVINIEVSGQLIADMSCNTGDDGKVTFDVSKFSGNYNYTITKDGGAFTATVSNSTLASIPLTGLGFGVYEITVFDNTTLCDNTASVTVAQPSIVTISEVSNVNANCKSNALVQVAGGGGTPDYTYAYVVSGTGITGTTVFSTSDSASLDPAISKTWDFYAKDANGCLSLPLLVTIAMDPLPAGFTALATQCPSATGTYTITVTDGPTGMGPFEYSIGTGFQTGKVFTVNAPGTYDLIVKDKFGCTTTFAAAVTILNPIVLDAQITALPSCTVDNGSITASATGGSGSYSYQLDGGLIINTTPAVFTGLASGSHTVVVTDSNNCTDTVTHVLSLPSPIDGFGVSKTDVICNGGSSGTITATMTAPSPGINDNPIYMFTLTGTTVGGDLVNVGPQTSNLFTGLKAGNYTVEVVSGRDCRDSKTITIIEPGLIIVPAPTVVEFACTAGTNTKNFATVTVAGVTGGSGTYAMYEFLKNGTRVQFSPSNVYTELNLSGGTNYTVIVTDSKGCTGSIAAPFDIDPYISLDKINVAITPINCDVKEEIVVTVDTTGGIPLAGTLTYAVTGISGTVYNPPTNTTGIFSNLGIGNYSITVTNTLTGCIIETYHYVNDPNTFQLNAVKTNDVICFGSNEGRVELTFVDASSPSRAGAFSYVLTDPLGATTSGNSPTAGPFPLTGLEAGLYSVTATLDGIPYCSVTTSFTINQPIAALNINETHTEITCVTGNNDGTISVTATGGWPGAYQYQLVGPVNVAYGSQTVFTNLPAGSYTINVKDAKGCEKPVTVNLAIPTLIDATISTNKTTLTCFGDTDGIITVQQPVTGGSGIYNYTLEATYLDGRVTLDGPQSSNVFTNLGAGSYKVIVSDTWNCSVVTNTIVINDPNIVRASLVGASIQTCLSPATVTLSAVGGTGPYTYSEDSNFTTVLGSFANSTTFPVLFTTVAVDHFYYVKDSNGCLSSASNSISVVPLDPFDFKFIDNAPYISCFGDNSGEITAVASGGQANYIYTLLDSAGNAILPAPSQPTPGYFKGLLAGNYSVEIVSGDCGPIRKPITITQPTTELAYTATEFDVTCNGNGDGKLVITASGGTGVIKFALSPDLDKFVENGTFLNLKTGSYQAIIQDERGCKFDYNFIINEPDPIVANVVPLSIEQEYCAGDKTGAFSITISDGVAPYRTSLDDPKATYVLGQVDFTGLSGGDHTVYIKDANECTFELPVALDKAVLLDPVANVNYDCVNDLPANKVTVTIDSSNNPADVVYSLDSSTTTQVSNVFENLLPGDHFIMAHHTNTCVDATVPFTIISIAPLAMTLDLGGLNEIVATTTGGSGVYTYSVNGEDIGSSNKYIYYHSGDYTVTVTDTNGCVFTATKYFEFVDIKIPNVFTPNGSGTNDTWKPTNTENYPDIQFVVYDRYSREVGRFGAGESWDGKYNNTELPMGDYWYVLKLNNSKDNREFIGHFTLYR